MTLRTGPLLLAASLLALALAGPAAAQEPVVAPGVTVSGVDVGGLNAADARTAIQQFFAQKMTFTLGGKVVSVHPAKVGGRPKLTKAVEAALAAAPGTALELEVAVAGRRTTAWLRSRARTFDRAARSSRAILVGIRPRVTAAKPGRQLSQKWARIRLVNALRANVRDLGKPLPVKTLRPAVTPQNFGPAVVIRRGSKRLTLYTSQGVGPMRYVAAFGVATGMAAYPTPLGSFRIATKQRNPWWYPPSAGWAAGASPIPPGPGNPLGTRWMGLNVGAVGIHGTPDAASIGYSASHGCVRMHISNAEWLFDRVRVGTPVFIVGS